MEATRGTPRPYPQPYSGLLVVRKGQTPGAYDSCGQRRVSLTRRASNLLLFGGNKSADFLTPQFIVTSPGAAFTRCDGTVYVIRRIRDLILQPSKSSIYSTKSRESTIAAIAATKCNRCKGKQRAAGIVRVFDITE